MISILVNEVRRCCHRCCRQLHENSPMPTHAKLRNCSTSIAQHHHHQQQHQQHNNKKGKKKKKEVRTHSLTNHSTIQPFNHSTTIQPFNHSTIQPFNHSTIQQPFNNHSTTIQQPFNNHSTIQRTEEGPFLWRLQTIPTPPPMYG